MFLTLNKFKIYKIVCPSYRISNPYSSDLTVTGTRTVQDSVVTRAVRRTG